MAEVRNISIEQLLHLVTRQFEVYLKAKQLDIPIIFKPITPAETIKDVGRYVVVTYRLARREPATMSGSPFSSSGKFYTPRPVEAVQDASGLVHEQVLMHIHENLVEFKFISDSYHKACEQSGHFEDFMYLNRDVLRQNGFPEITFWQRTNDESEEINGKVLYYVTQQYYVRTKRLIVVSESVVRNIELVLHQSVGA